MSWVAVGWGHSWPEQSRQGVCRGGICRTSGNGGLYPIFPAQRGACTSDTIFHQSHHSRDIYPTSVTAIDGTGAVLFKVSWLFGVKVFLAYATVSHLIEIIRRHVPWERQLFLQWTIKHPFTLQFTSPSTLRGGYQLKRSVNFMLWDFVVFDVHEPDRLPSAVLRGGGRTVIAPLICFTTSVLGRERSMIGIEGLMGVMTRCKGALVVRVQCGVEVRGSERRSYRVLRGARDKIEVRTRQIRGSLPLCADDISPKF